MLNKLLYNASFNPANPCNPTENINVCINENFENIKSK